MSNCNCHKESIRDGSGQLTRYLKALDPSYAPVDDRSIEELLIFIQQYAKRIRFYDIPESQIADVSPEGKVSWEAFFKKDMAFIAASVGLTDAALIHETYNRNRQSFETDPNEENLAKLFQESVAIASAINDWYGLAIMDNPLRGDLDLAIHSVLADGLQRIMAYEAGYKLINPVKPMNLEYGKLDDNELWGTDDIIPPDVSIYAGNNEKEKVLNAALYADEVFNSFWAVLKNLLNKSEDYMRFALEQYPNHQPHAALFIAFLQLFQLAQQQMNGLTERMLDFYYKDVLQLRAKDAIPDKVHLVFELAKNIAEYDLKQNTPVKAGKDDAGVEQIYATGDDLVINQAKIQEIKNVFIEKEVSENDSIIKSVYANPVANSADGAGKPFDKQENAQWDTFGALRDMPINVNPICNIIGKMKKDSAIHNVAMPGFSVASPQLVLGGGNRQVIVASDGISQLIEHFVQSGNSNPFTIWLTGEKGWLKVDQNATDRLKGLLDGEIFNDGTGIENPVYGLLEANDTTMGIVLFLPVSTDAIVPFDEKLHPGYSYKTAEPVMQVMLNPGFNIPESIYNQVSTLNFYIKVKVGSMNVGQNADAAAGIVAPPHMDGLKKLILQNDDQALPLGKAFNPFTFQPANGKSFYIGSQEVFNKPLSQLSINIRSTQSNAIQTVNLFLLKNKQWVPLPADGSNTFDYDELTGDVLQHYATPIDRKPVLNFTALDSTTLKGFIRLDHQPFSKKSVKFSANLSPQQLLAEFEMKEVSLSYTSELTYLKEGIDQFFHVYPFGVAEIQLKQSYQNSEFEKDVAAGKMASRKQALSLFSGKDSSILSNRFFPGNTVVAASGAIDGRNKLLPQFTFTGYFDIQKQRDTNTKEQPTTNEPATSPAENETLGVGDIDKLKVIKRLETPDYYRNFIFPELYKRKISQYFGKIQEEGLLYIGLCGTKPLQSVSLLFQFAEGSAIDEDNDPPKIHWAYLSHNQWCPLAGENLIKDGTYGFQTTGIIKCSIPQDATDDNTIVASGLHWLRISVSKNANRIPMLISVVTQAVSATFMDQQNSKEHYTRALPAGSAEKLKNSVSQVSKVIQPFASFDGKPQEVGKEFYTRVSERLRHKHRAITAWDYEHLILDRFPSVYKVKCITHTDPNCLCRKTESPGGTEPICCGSQVAPGHVLLVPIADLKNRNGVDPLQPKTARRVLIDMVNYIKSLTSPFVKVYAKNPVYEQIIVSFKVKFYSGEDIGFYLKKLNDEIVQYLTPWAFDESAEVIFGQKVYASSIINFIEKRPYVDFITDFIMGVCKEDCCPAIDTKTDDAGKEETPVEIINSFSDCADVEAKFSENIEKSGYIVATPSTARSILVSASKHVIIPYEAPPVITPCELRKQKRETGATVGNIVSNAAVDTKPAVNVLQPSFGIKKTPTMSNKATEAVIAPLVVKTDPVNVASNKAKRVSVVTGKKTTLPAKENIKVKKADSKLNIKKTNTFINKNTLLPQKGGSKNKKTDNPK